MVGSKTLYLWICGSMAFVESSADPLTKERAAQWGSPADDSRIKNSPRVLMKWIDCECVAITISRLLVTELLKIDFD